MKRKIVQLLLSGVIISSLLFTPVVAHAEDFQFDLNYYVNKYPDVYNNLGSDYETVYNHYILYGQYEGRYVSQAEESWYFNNGTIKQPLQRETITVENPTEVKETKVAPVYVPIEVTPKYDTYVDVDKTNQVVTYFENGNMVIQGPCVTGNEKTKHGTPTGTFSITQHMTNKYLIGPTWKSYVSYWMRFSSDGCGLHDATWRSEFGGDIYKTNGSHGCVNLQKDFAKQIFDYTKIGTTVYVHD